MAFLETDPVDFLFVDGDMVITDDIFFTSGLPGIVQGVEIVLKFFKGEYFLDLDAGVPYLEREGVLAAEAILGQKFDSQKAKEAIRPLILGVPGILSITALETVFVSSTRATTIDWGADTVFGEAVATVEVV